MQTLNALQKAHLLTVPFENLDIHLNRKIDLDISKIFSKIVDDRRGGFCYELNGIFFELLIALGFNAIRVNASVYQEDKGYGKPFEHLATIVEIEQEKYLSDVGFGEFAMQPLKLKLKETQVDQRGQFIITKYNADYHCVSKFTKEKGIPQYIFETKSYDFSAFEEMCDFQQTSPISHFTQKRLISMVTETGRITISNQTVKIRNGEQVNEYELKDEADFNQKIWSYFKVKL